MTWDPPLGSMPPRPPARGQGSDATPGNCWARWRGGGDPRRAGAVAFTTVVGGQLAQTLELGVGTERRSRAVDGAVLGSAAFVAAAVALPPLQGFFGLAMPGPFGLALCAGAILASVAISRALAGERAGGRSAERLALPAPASA